MSAAASSSRTTTTTTTKRAVHYSKRKCDWCRRTRSVRAFQKGSPTCRQCVQGRATAEEFDIAIRRGEGARKCPACESVDRYSLTDMERSAFPRNAAAASGLQPYCFPCTRQRLRALYRKHPEKARARSRAVNEAVKSDPVLLARRRAYQKRSRQRMRKDPQRWARWLADDRMRRRLKAEREGRVITMRRSAHLGYVRPTGCSEALPEAPLRAWLEAVIFSKGEDLDLGVLAYDLGIAERQLRGVRIAEYPHRSLSLADTMLTRYERVVAVPGYGLVCRVEDLWPIELGEEDIAA